MIANTTKPPYYAVIFTSLRTEVNKGYHEAAIKMKSLAKQQEGYLGVESVRNNLGISVSYWDSLEAIKKWKNNIEHTIVKEKGKTLWYKNYHLRICKVEKDYLFKKE